MQVPKQMRVLIPWFRINVQRQGIIVAVKLFPTELQRLSARRVRDTHILKISQADWELHQGVF